MKKSLLVIVGLLVILPACQIVTRLENNPSLIKPTVEPTATPIDLQKLISDNQPIIPDTGGSSAPQIHPGPRMWASFFYDPVSQQPVLYGGGRAVDAWRLDVTNGTWRIIETEYQPDPLRMGGVGAALDTRADRLIVFFYMGVGLPGETWELNLRSHTWKNLNPGNPPPSRRFTTLVYDTQAEKHCCLAECWAMTRPPRPMSYGLTITQPMRGCSSSRITRLPPPSSITLCMTQTASAC